MSSTKNGAPPPRTRITAAETDEASGTWRSRLRLGARRGGLRGGQTRAPERHQAPGHRERTNLERLAGSFPEGHMARLLIESAVGSARMRDARKAGSEVSRSRSAIEGSISTPRGSLSRESSE
jgi:hypothetical protein